jgi:hypothetical protein
MNEFYVYLFLDPRTPAFQKGKIKLKHEPFYVGKGKGLRCYSHFYNYKKSAHFFHRKLKKMLNDKVWPIVLIYKSELLESQAFKLEVQLIQTIGTRKDNTGPLTNLTNGGEGCSGFKPTTKQKLAMSKAIKSSEKWLIFFKSKKYKQNLKKISTIAKKKRGVKYEQRYGIKAEEIKKKIKRNHVNVSGENNPMYGKKQQKVTKVKIASKLRGNKNSLNKVRAKFIFINKYDRWEIIGQRNARTFCKQQGISFQTLCKLSGRWKEWLCKRGFRR